MGRSGDRPVRQWMFWRKAFWARPALLMVYGIGCGVAGAVMLLAVPNTYADGEAMERAHVCRTPAELDCLEAVPGYLDGPHYKRRAGDRWYLRDGAELAQGFEGFDMATAQSHTLKQVSADTVVTGLVWGDRIVAVQLPDGRRVPTDEYGTSEWWTLLLMALFVLGAAPMCVHFALSRRRAGGGWWSVTMDGSVPQEPGRLMAVAVLLVIPALTGFVPIMFLTSVPLSVGATALGTALAGFGAFRLWRRHVRT